MTITVVNIIPAKLAEASQTTQYTANDGKTVIDKMVATNVGSANATISVNLVPSSGVAGNDNLVVDARTIEPGGSYEFPELVGQAIENSGFISTIASTAAAIMIRATGREIT